MRVLVIEDEAGLREVLVATLQEEGYAVDSSGDGEEGLYKAITWDYDAVLLDIMLPKLDGWSLLEKLRAKKTTPVIMLTARDSVADRVKGLDCGADDYLPKPFDLDELLARIRAIDRRSKGKPNPIFQHGDITINTSTQVVTYKGEVVYLTAREYNLTELFLKKANEVITRDYIYEHLFDEKEDTLSNMLDVYIYKLRQHFGKDFITTIRRQGYISHSP